MQSTTQCNGKMKHNEYVLAPRIAELRLRYENIFTPNWTMGADVADVADCVVSCNGYVTSVPKVPFVPLLPKELRHVKSIPSKKAYFDVFSMAWVYIRKSMLRPAESDSRAFTGI